MIYPLMTFPDTTEMTFSKEMQDENGAYLIVYFERWNDTKEDFDELKVRVPNGEILLDSGFADKDVRYLVNCAKKLRTTMISLIPEFDEGRITINAHDM